jgi:hypothetical protein
MCCWSAKDGLDTLGVKQCVNPGIQLVRVGSQYPSMIGLRNTVEALLKQPEQRFRLTFGLTPSPALDASLFAFLRQDRHHRLPLLIRRPGQRPLDRPAVDRIVRSVDIDERTHQKSAPQPIVDRRQHRRTLPARAATNVYLVFTKCTITS